MKRILLFVLTNIAVMVVVGIVTSLLGVGRYTGTNTGQLMIFSLVVGFAGAIVGGHVGPAHAQATPLRVGRKHFSHVYMIPPLT